MIKKISLILIILIFATGFAYSAQNINDLQIPNDFSGKKSEGQFFMPKAYDNPRFIIERFRSFILI